VRPWATLFVGDRDQPELRKSGIDDWQVRHVLTTVRSREGAAGKLLEEWIMQIVDVKVQDVKLIRAPACLIEHNHVMGQRIPHPGVKAQRVLSTRRQLRRGQRVATREQGHLVALPDQLFSQVGNDPLGTAVEAGWDALDERSDLRYLHFKILQYRCHP
jgi:hypothetical protein